MKCTTIISAVVFAVILLSALFLFIRDYPNDRWFSVVFIVAGGVLLCCRCGAEAGGDAGEARAAENKIEFFYDKPAASTLTDATNERDENGSIAGEEQ